jgi:hypothetical protein
MKSWKQTPPKLAALCCNVGSLASEPDCSSYRRITTLTRCYYDRRLLLCDVTGARCYCDWAPL